MSITEDIDNYVGYIQKPNFSIPSETLRNALILKLIGTMGGADLSNSDAQTNQDETIALLTKLTTQLDFTNSIGVVQPSQTTTVTSTVQEILPLSGTRKRVRITNHSSDSLLIELNGEATTTRGQIIGAGQTWESPGREEARSRITVISGSGNDILISYQETSDSVFFIGEQTIINQSLNIIDIRYPIIIFGATQPLASMTVELYEEGVETAIATNNYNTGLEPAATINVDFLGINGFNGIEPKAFYIVVSGD